ncbi:hypothetical protein [Thermovibrio ammonificans]|jgi:hypothetical protein
MRDRRSERYLDELLRQRAEEFCADHLEMYLDFKKADSKEKLLALLRKHPFFRELRSRAQSMSYEELRDAVAHALVEEIFSKEALKRKLKDEIDSMDMQDR